MPEMERRLMGLRSLGNTSRRSRRQGAFPSIDHDEVSKSAARVSTPSGETSDGRSGLLDGLHDVDYFYRIYILSDGNAITGAVNRFFHDDSEALSHAGQYLTIHPAVEIWRTDRLVGRLEREPVIGGHETPTPPN